MPGSLSPNSSPSRANPPTTNNTGEVSCLKRKVAALQEELDEANNAKAKKPPTTVTMGRGIRRLVTLYDSLEDLIDEADQQFQDDDDEVEEFADEETYERNPRSRLKLAAYAMLLQVLPDVKTMIEDPHISTNEFTVFLVQAQKGANDARSDDVRRIKEEVALWLNFEYAPAPPMLVKSRSDRGLQSEVAGRLLCPVEYDWDNERVHSEIQAGTLDISGDFFLRCLYPFGKGDADNVEKGFLSSKLLLKTYGAIFTSPSSSEAFDAEDEGGQARKQRRTSSQKKATKSNVATLLHMEGRVTPRSIAYAAVLLAFNLTDATQWVEVYGHFNFCALYAFIIDFFEDPSAGPAAVARTKRLLKWWDNQIFPNHVGASSDTRKARNKLAAQRSAREESTPL
ncbi:hypothetical protein BJ912DRAFT_855623 [Pholiota molesta]|nr:hypothetical protein BJ912DRAFT_855623 [Pholiota molesta]